MAYFKDTHGRDWQIRLTGPKLAQVRDATQIALADPSGAGVLQATADGEIQTRILWLLCADQDPQITPAQFADAVASGECFEAARSALHQALLDFTPPSQRLALQKALETELEVQAQAQALAIERLSGGALRDQLIDALRAGMDQNLATILTQLRNAGGSPALPASIPTAPRSEN